MHFSGKITNSILTYLGQKTSDQDRLFDLTDLPTEFLRDPSCWLRAFEVETFLAAIESEYGRLWSETNLIGSVGHAAFDLRSWGVLDSVLRMMQTPQDIYLQPHRFLSYFVSPAPPIGHLIREQESVAFDLPISSSEFPFVTEYLRAALESLPRYLGQQMSVVRWRGNKILISWSEAQRSFLEQEDMEFNIKPELMQSLVTNLEVAQQELEEQKKSLLLVQEENEQLKKEVEHLSQSANKTSVVDADFDKLKADIMRLSDYMARSQQLVTLLIKQDRLDNQVREAMRRVDWDYIRQQYPVLVQQIYENIANMKPQSGKRLSSKMDKNKIQKSSNVNLSLFNM